MKSEFTSFIWDDFCSWYLEMVKPGMNESISKDTYDQTISIFTQICSLLHPYMPFITEEIWHGLNEEVSTDCILSSYPLGGEVDEITLSAVEHAKKLITQVREVRSKNGIKAKEELALYAKRSGVISTYNEIQGYSDLCIKMANLATFITIDNDEITGVNFITDAEKYFVALDILIDAAKEHDEKVKELKHQRSFVEGIEKKLANEKFVSGAPLDVIEKERKKMADGNDRIKILEGEIAKLS